MRRRHACRCIYLEEKHPGTHVGDVWSITVTAEASQTCSQKWVRQFALPCHTAPSRDPSRILSFSFSLSFSLSLSLSLFLFSSTAISFQYHRTISRIIERFEENQAEKVFFSTRTIARCVNDVITIFWFKLHIYKFINHVWKFMTSCKTV